jgi:hypothetical protein
MHDVQFDGMLFGGYVYAATVSPAARCDEDGGLIYGRFPDCLWATADCGLGRGVHAADNVVQRGGATGSARLGSAKTMVSLLFMSSRRSGFSP